MTKIGERLVRPVRGYGGTIKYRGLRLEAGNFSWAGEAITRKTRILSVGYHPSSNELVRTNTLTKHSIVQIDAAPFRQWYERYYGISLGKKGSKAGSTGDKKGAKPAAKKPSTEQAKGAKKEEVKKDAASKGKDAKKDATKKPEAKKDTKKPEAKKDAKAEGKKDAKAEGKKDAKAEGKKGEAKKEKPVAKKAEAKKEGKPEAKKAEGKGAKKEVAKEAKKGAKKEGAKKVLRKGKTLPPWKDIKKEKIVLGPRAIKTQHLRAKRRVPLDTPLEELFGTGRVWAMIVSRPGQSGRADGYVLEGKELDFYLKKMQKKKK